MKTEDANISPVVRDLIDEGYTIFNADIERMKSVYYKKPFTLEVFEELLRILHITIRFNLATKDTEVIGIENSQLEYADSNIFETLLTKLLSITKDLNLTKCNENDIKNYVLMVARENSYHPVIDMFREDIPTSNNFDTLCEIIGIQDKPNEKTYLKMFFGQAVALQFNYKSRDPIALDFVLVLLGAQGIGKTSLLRKIAIYPEWFTEGASLDMRVKDSIIIATKRPFCELGEFDATTGKKQSNLKSFFSNRYDEYRLPYGKSYGKRPRNTSFAATVNDPDFLHDPTGSRRYLVIELTKIDKQRLFSLPDEFFKGLWREAYLEYLKDPDYWRMTDDLIVLTLRRNESYRVRVRYEAEIEEALDWSSNIENWEYIRALDLKQYLEKAKVLHSADVRHIGRALKVIARNHPDVRFKKTSIGNTYLLPRLKEEIERRATYY